MVALMKILILIAIKYFWKDVYVNDMNILYYDRIDVFLGTDFNKTKTSVSKERITFHYWYSLEKWFKF